MFDIKKAVISAPFGIYCPIPNTTRTVGTYTYEARPGAVINALKTIRYTNIGIVNKISLRNPGIRSVNFDNCKDKIISIGGLTPMDWLNVILSVPEWATVELNISCVNVDMIIPNDILKELFDVCAERFDNVIVKLPTDMMRACKLIDMAEKAGIKTFNACNTIRVDKGGLSGRMIQNFSIPLVKFLKRNSFKVIAGGGVYTKDDVRRYQDADADYISLATIFIRCPWKLPEVMKAIYEN